MVFFNYALRKLNAKIVYYGPGLCGKTTNLVWIHDHFEGGEHTIAERADLPRRLRRTKQIHRLHETAVFHLVLD